MLSMKKNIFHFLDILSNNFYKYLYKLYNLYKYKNILEYVPNLDTKIKNQTYSINSPDTSILIDTINTICNNLNTKNIIISLSGGLDSMVLTTILQKSGFNIVGIHINYNNRVESKDEESFLREWCKFNDIKLYVNSLSKSIKRGNMKRSDYESKTKEIRLNFYKKIMKEENIDYVLLAHHKDDIIENIMANICRGRNYLDLAVIRERTSINGINMIRPMISFYKSEIYKYAHLNNVPYFKDTTPDWSVRGKYRKIISPALEDTFTKNIKENLLIISNQCDDWNLLIQQEIILPFLSNIIYKKNKEVSILTINIEYYINYPISFWNVIFNNIFNQYYFKSPSKRAIQSLIETVKLGKNQNFNLSNNCKCKIENFNIIIEFKNKIY